MKDAAAGRESTTCDGAAKHDVRPRSAVQGLIHQPRHGGMETTKHHPDPRMSNATIAGAASSRNQEMCIGAIVS